MASLCRKEKFSEKLKPCVSRTITLQQLSFKFSSGKGKKKNKTNLQIFQWFYSSLRPDYISFLAPQSL